MRIRITCLLLTLSVFLPSSRSLADNSWPNLEKAVNSWNGDKKVIFLNEEDPLSSAKTLPLVELFLQNGFAVIAAETGKEGIPSTGLMVDIRRQGPHNMFVLLRASDRAIIALDLSKREILPESKKAAVNTSKPPKTSSAFKDILISLDDKPVAITLLGSAGDEQTQICLLSKNGLKLYQLQDNQLRLIYTISPPEENYRPLFLSSGDINNDGILELAAIWAEDIHSIYDGIDSNIWSQVLTYDKNKLIPIEVIPGYVRLFSKVGVTQQRGTFSLFETPVRKLFYQNGELIVGQDLSWGGMNIFALTFLSADTGIAWLQPGELSLLSSFPGSKTSKSKLLEKFGTSQATKIAIRLEEAEFLSGFEKEDKILERYIPLPHRLQRISDNKAYTIYRGRQPGSFFTKGAVGKDRIAEIVVQKNQLSIEYPFPAIDAFIIDFAILNTSKSLSVFLLLNEKIDATGNAFLKLQTRNHIEKE